jgi:hypothetical protein
MQMQEQAAEVASLRAGVRQRKQQVLAHRCELADMRAKLERAAAMGMAPPNCDSDLAQSVVVGASVELLSPMARFPAFLIRLIVPFLLALCPQYLHTTSTPDRCSKFVQQQCEPASVWSKLKLTRWQAQANEGHTLQLASDASLTSSELQPYPSAPASTKSQPALVVASKPPAPRSSKRTHHRVRSADQIVRHSSGSSSTGKGDLIPAHGRRSLQSIPGAVKGAAKGTAPVHKMCSGAMRH